MDQISRDSTSRNHICAPRYPSNFDFADLITDTQIDGRTTPQHDIESLPQPPPERLPSSHELLAASPNLPNPSDQREDFNQTINHLTEEASPPLAPALTPYDVQRLLYHTSALLHHSKTSRELEPVNSTIRNLRHLLDYPLEHFNVHRHSVTRSLAEMLAMRVNMKEEGGDALKDIDEVVVLCGKLLTPNTSPCHLARASQALTQAVLDGYHRGTQLLPLDQTTEFLREALKTCTPDFRHVSLDLANLLAVRFLTSHNEDDYEEARQVLHETTHSHSPGDRNDPYFFQASSLATALGIAQSILSSSAEDLGVEISRCYSFTNHSSLFGNPLHPVITELLRHHASTFSKHLGPGQGVPTTHLCVDRPLSPLPLGPEGGVGASGHDTTQTGPSPLVEVEKKIRGLRNRLSTTKLGTDGRKEGLRELVRLYEFKIHRTKNIGDIKDAIKCHRMLLDSVHPGDSSRFMDLSSFANLLLQAYEQTHETGTEYLYESIALHYEVLKQESAEVTHFRTMTRLISLLSIRHRLSNCERDMDEIMDRYKSGVNDRYATAPSRFELACRWADFARIHRHSSLLVAYQMSMSLLREALTFEPTLIIQHNRLVEKHYLYETMPLNFASYQIREGQVEHAIETLEQGRALLWSEMHGLRTSSHQLRAEFPILADCFTTINRELEVLTTSPSPSGNVDIDNWEVPAHGGNGQHQRLMLQQQGLLTKRIELISQIRDLPNFKDFLKPPSFDTLRSAASRGVVIIINHCKWRSDIIIVLSNSTPLHISTSYRFFGRANELKDKLLTARRDHGLESDHYNNVLGSVLADLYELVGEPVIKKLNELRIPEQTRVWWCPTSVFGYLPLHAMGPIPSRTTSPQPRYFSDLYISSYTTTLSALIASRNPRTPMPVLPNILDVQPSPPARANIQVIQDLDLEVTCLTPGNVTAATLINQLPLHRLADIGYHGVLEEGKPFSASLRFHTRDYLTILDLVRLRIPICEFAFLPGSHTAELTEGSIPGEALHFAAAVQYLGCRSVIGSMWATLDRDGQNLAKDVYFSMFAGDDHGVPYYERSARALRDAVKKMRDRGVPLARWVGFVHFGA